MIGPGEILRRLDTGAALHMQFVDGARVWWMMDGLEHLNVPDKIATAMLHGGFIEEAGDSLFGLRNNSQTYTKAAK